MDEQLPCKEDVRLVLETMVKPRLARAPATTVMVTATLAAAIAIGLLSAVAILFQRDGVPLAHFVAAERACSLHAYVSDRESCVREWLAASPSAVARTTTLPQSVRP